MPPSGSTEPTARIGRPRDPAATARTIAAVQELLATQGPSVTIDAVVAKAGVGKATIYRRWSAAEDLIAEAVLATDPLPPPPDPAQPAALQVRAVLRRLTEPLTAAERTVAVAVALAPWDAVLQQAAEQVLLEPLRARLRCALGAVGRPAWTAGQVTTAVELVEGLWVRRCVLGTPLDPAQLDLLVERVLASAPRAGLDRPGRRLL